MSSSKIEAEQAIYDCTRATRQDAAYILVLPEVIDYFKQYFQKKIIAKHRDGSGVFVCPICNR